MNFGLGSGIGFSDLPGGSGPPPTPQNLQDTLTVGNFTDLSILWDRVEPDLPFPGLATHIWQRYNPLVPGQPRATPFLVSQSSQKNFAGGLQNEGNDEVFDFGWNLAPGGGAFVGGLPGIGYQLEANYFPFAEQLVESHQFYIDPAGAQIRLQSFTVFTGSGNIDLFFTAGHTSIKDPSSGLVYYSLTGGTHVVDMTFIDQTTSETRGIEIDSTAALKFFYIGLYSGNNDFAVTRLTDATIQAVGFDAAAGFFAFKSFGGVGDVLPDIDAGMGFGRFNKRWLRMTAVQLTTDYNSYILSAVNPTNTDIILDNYQVWYNTALDELRVWGNVGGILRSVLLV